MRKVASRTLEVVAVAALIAVLAATNSESATFRRPAGKFNSVVFQPQLLEDGFKVVTNFWRNITEPKGNSLYSERERARRFLK